MCWPRNLFTLTVLAVSAWAALIQAAEPSGTAFSCPLLSRNVH